MKKEYVYVSKEEYIETNNENIRLTAENIELNLELQRKDNNWNELKEILKEKKEFSRYQNDAYRFTAYEYVLNKIKELESK